MILSGGEREQQLAFGLLFLQRPNTIAFDEAPSARDHECRHNLFVQLTAELAESTNSNVDHREGSKSSTTERKPSTPRIPGQL
jgi:ABC-type uncharacterized transport system fused permease/ATPase subunit